MKNNTIRNIENLRKKVQYSHPKNSNLETIREKYIKFGVIFPFQKNSSIPGKKKK